MRRIWAIAWLTFREGIRMRVVLVFLVVLVVLILLMPSYLRGDETLAGRLQNFLDYSLGTLGVLNLFLSAATIFFSCATLSTEFKERSLHLVVTKPVARFQILVGKWLGVNLLNVLIVLLCGVAIYGFSYRIKTLPVQFDRDRYKLRDVVWTARVAANPVVPRAEMTTRASEYVRERIERGEIDPGAQRKATNERLAEELKAWRVIPSGYARQYWFENLPAPERDDALIQVRFKIIGQPLPIDELLDIGWLFLNPQTGAPLHEPRWTRERSTDVHQFLVRAAPVVRDGQAVLEVRNPYDPRTARVLILDGDDSLQILYKVGSFEVNFAKALLIILLRLALLSALGVFFSVFVSFPVACLCTCAFYLICLGMPFWLESMGVETSSLLPRLKAGASWGEILRNLFVPVMRIAFPDFTHYDGARFVIDGGYISYRLLARCVVHTLLYGGLLLLLPGWLIFRTREVAEVQV